MPFEIPNDTTAGVGAATYAGQAEVDEGDIAIIAAAAMGTGVSTGSAVPPITAQSSPDMTVKNSGSGYVYVAGTAVSVSTITTLTIGAAHASLDRIDLIGVNSAGTVAVIAGTAATHPCYPAIPRDADNNLTRCILAAVYVPATITTITNARITDKRIYLDTPEDSITAKGDILAGTGTKALAKLTVSSLDGDPLVSSSAAASGLVYAEMSAPFGDGSDSNWSPDGTDTGQSFFTYATAFGVGTYTLNRDIYCMNIAITTSLVTVIATNGYKIFVRNELSIANNCLIRNIGGAGANGGATGGVAGAGGTLGIAGPGGIGNAGAAGSVGSNTSYSIGGAGGAGGLNTGSPATGGGAAGGSATAPVQNVGGIPRNLTTATLGLALDATSFKGGAGGAGGTSAAGTGRGGAGGGGGGLVAIYARILTNNYGNSAISATGGAGSNATAGNSTNVGGGGGGGGGGTIIVYRYLAGASTTYNAGNQAAGGAGGTGVGTGRTGAAGSTGTLLLLKA